MSVSVYPFPPVSVLGSEWTMDYPYEGGRSLLTGAQIRTAGQRERRIVSLDVSGIGTTGNGAGYIEALKRLLQSRNAVRLYSYSAIHWGYATTGMQSTRVDWTTDGTDLNWTTDGTDLTWYTGRVIYGTTGTDSDGYNTVSITGAPPNSVVSQPGEYLTIFADEDDTTGETVMMLNKATSDGSGDATIRVIDDSLSSHTAARVNLGTSDTGVFMLDQYPRSMRPVGGSFRYSFSFREVFSDEVDGGFTEMASPW